MTEREVRLGDVVLGGQIDTRGRVTRHCRERGYRLLFGGPGAEELFNFRAHVSRGEIALHGEDHVRGEEVALVESDQVVSLDVVDVLVLHAPSVGIVAAVHDFCKSTVQDVAWIVVPTGDGTTKLLFR